MKYILTIIAICLAFAVEAQTRPARTATNNQPAVVTGDSAKPKGKGELIKPIKVWKAGNTVDADEIDLTIVYDGLNDSTATVYYTMKDSTGAQVADGNLTIGKTEYRQFNTAPNRINWVYNFVIRALRLQQRQQTVN